MKAPEGNLGAAIFQPPIEKKARGQIRVFHVPMGETCSTTDIAKGLINCLCRYAVSLQWVMKERRTLRENLWTSELFATFSGRVEQQEKKADAIEDGDWM